MASPFRQTDLSRAIKAARGAGLTVVKTVVRPDGGFELIFSEAGGGSDSLSPLDRWMKENP